MSKRKIIEISDGPRTQTRLNEWAKRQTEVEQFTQGDPGGLIPGGQGGPGGCGHCLPIAPQYTVDGSGNVIDDQGNIVDTIDSNGNPSEFGPFSLTGEAVDQGGGTYQVPANATHVTDVWFDDLRASRGQHWEFSPDRTLTVFSPIIPGTIVKAALVTP